MAAFLAAALALQAAGSIYSATQQKKQMEQEAIDLESSMKELQFRTAINAKEIDVQSQSLYGEQIAATAYGGAQIDTGSPLQNYANNFEKAITAKINMQHEATYQMGVMKKNASQLRSQAKKAMLAGFLGAGANASQGVYNYQRDTGKIG